MPASRDAALLALLGFLCLTGPVTAQGLQCGARDALLETLAEHHKERVVSRGLTSGGALLEVLAGPSGSWSILVTRPGGPTCLVSSGEGWRRLPAADEGAGSGDGPAV
ncbi:MAG TPA: hypothetical protein EYH07_17365 [Kiloniellaceae bacterium]|nr:hypothetical protein [Kiloniellaceae bacterium]